MSHSLESGSNQLPPNSRHDSEVAEPKVFNKTAGEVWSSDTPDAIGRNLAESYQMSPEGIRGTSIVIDDKSRLSYRGSQTPKWLDRLARGSKPENQGKGSVVRVATKIRGRERTVEEVNETLNHELEHAAQADRQDIRVHMGNAAIWGLAALGAAAGYKFGRNKYMKAVGTVMGGAAGQAVGYKIASHERQARKKAAETPLSLITKRKKE